MGLAMGFEMEVLDIGGGFCGGDFDASGNVDLGGVPSAVNEALDKLFPDEGEGSRGNYSFEAMLMKIWRCLRMNWAHC